MNRSYALLSIVAIFLAVGVAHSAEFKYYGYNRGKHLNLMDAYAAKLRERSAQNVEFKRTFKWPHLKKCYDHYWYNDRKTWYQIMESPYIRFVDPCRNNMAKAKHFNHGTLAIYFTMKNNQANRRRRLLETVSESVIETASESVNSEEGLIARVSSSVQKIYDGYKPTWKRTTGHLCDVEIFNGVKYDIYGRFNWKCREAPQLCKCIGAISDCFKKNHGNCQLSFEGAGGLELHFKKSGHRMQYSIEKDGNVIRANDINGGKPNNARRRRLLGVNGAAGGS